MLNNTNNKPILVEMNVSGGEVFHGWGIYDAMKYSKSPIDIEVYGQALSMGAIILQAGRKRSVHQHATIMVHDGYINKSRDEPSRTNESWGRWSTRDRNRMYKIFADRSGKPTKYWREKCSADYILTPEDAVSEGLADKVIRNPILKRRKK